MWGPLMKFVSHLHLNWTWNLHHILLELEEIKVWIDNNYASKDTSNESPWRENSKHIHNFQSLRKSKVFALFKNFYFLMKNSWLDLLTCRLGTITTVEKTRFLFAHTVKSRNLLQIGLTNLQYSIMNQTEHMSVLVNGIILLQIRNMNIVDTRNEQ